MNKQIGKLILGGGIAISAALAAASAQAISFTPVSGGPQRMPVALVANNAGAFYTRSSDRIWKTTNNGQTWTALASLPPVFPRGIVISGTRLFANTAKGIYRSADDGATWEAFNGSGNGALPTLNVQNIHASAAAVFAWVLDSSFNTVLLRSSADSAAWSVVTPSNISSGSIDELVTAGSNLCLRVGNSGVKYSTDGGLSWASSSGPNGSFAALAVSPADPTVVYLVQSAGQIYRSANSCQTFTTTTSTGLKNLVGRSVTALGVNSAGAVFAGLNDGNILSSTDNGATFADANSGSLPANSGIGINSLLPAGTGMFAGTAGFGAHLKGAGSNWVERNTGLKGAAITDLISGDGNDGLFAGHWGGVLGSADGGASFADLNSGLSKRMIRGIARNGTTVVAGTDGDNSLPGMFRSTDSGATWTRLDTGSGLPANASVGSLVRASGAFIATVTGANDVATTGVYTSADGAAWTAATGLPANLGFAQRNLAVAADNDAYLYVSNSAGSINSGIWRSTNNGASWSLTTGTGFAASNNRQGKVFAAGNVLIASGAGLVYRSTNDGASWTAATGYAQSKFGIEIISLAADDNNVLYLGDEHAGLSISKDGGANWVPDSDGLAQSAVCIERINGLVFKNGKLYAGQGEGGGIRVADPIGAATPGDSVACTTDTDTFPSQFSFTSLNNVPPGQYAQASAFISGIASGVQVPVSVAGGEYSIGCSGTWTSADGMMGNSSVCVRHMTPNTSETATSTTLTVGDQFATFTTRTGLVYNGRADEINTSWGSGGFATVQGTNGVAQTVLVQPDGKVLLAGTTLASGFVNRFAIARQNADGTPDSGFGAGGLVTLTIGTADTLKAIVRQADGKIIAVGQTTSDNGTPQNGTDDYQGIALARLNENGTLDTTYGAAGTGIITLDINPNDKVRTELVGDAKLLSDGSLVVAGSVQASNSGQHFWAIKFTSAGVQDTSFGNASSTFLNPPVNHFIPGVFQTRVIQSATAFSQVYDLAVQSDGKLLLTGFYQGSGQPSFGVVVRATAGGAVDTYGTNGIVTVVTPGGLTDATVLAGNKLMLGGYQQVGNSNQGFLARLNDDGTFDTTFSADGMHTLTGFTASSINKLVVLGSGKLSILGGATIGGTSSLLYAILNANGTYDSAFGPGGQGYVLRGPLNGQAIDGQAMAQRSDGGMIVAGSFRPSNTTLFATYVFGGNSTTTPPDPDTTPEAFSFNPHTGAQLSTVIVSNAATITGINQPANVTVAGGEYSIGCNGSFTAAAGTISNGQTVCVRHTTSAQLNTQTSTTLTVGGVSATYTSTTRQADTTPADFQFPTQGDVARNTVITSAPATITGIEAPAAISVSNGSYAIGSGGACGSTFVTTAGAIGNNQTVCARHTSSNLFGEAIDTVVTVGGVARTFRSVTVAADTTPAQFTFTDVTGVEPGSTQTSNSVTVTGINAPAEISVTGGSYSIDGGNFVTAAGTVAAGQAVRVRHTASANTSTAVNTVLTIGGSVSDTFTSTTRADLPPVADTTPDPFNFANVTGATPGAAVVSNSITVSGINQPAPISVSTGEYSIDGGAYTSQAGAVQNGQTVRLRRNAGPLGGSVTVRAAIGGVEDTWRITSANEQPGTVSVDGRTGSVKDSQGETVAVTVPAGGAQIVNLRRVIDPAAAPTGLRFPNGFFAFDVTGLAAGGSVDVTITLPAGVRPTNYVKCIASSCFRLPESKARISGNTVTLTLTDGDPQTDAGPANDGAIVDPGAPAITVEEDNGGSFGFALLLPLLGFAALRRRKLH